MKIKTKRILLILLLALGISWDCLCAWHVVPISLFTVSAVAVGGYSFMILFIPLLFSGGAQAREKSTYLRDLTAREKKMSQITLSLGFVWIATLLLCIVNPF